MKNNNIQSKVYIGLIVALLSVSTFIRIPMYPVSVTMQTFIIFLIPFIFGAKISFISVLIYIFLGLIGLPIFSNGGGIGYIFMPTFGYLIGYLISVVFAGIICNKNKIIMNFVFAGILSIVIIHACGIIGLYININYIQDKNILFSSIFKSGIVFVIPDLIKLILATIIIPYTVRVVNSIGYKV